MNSTAAAWSDHIIQAHAQRFPGFPAQPSVAPSELTETSDTALAALQACSHLGFIATDALCLAHAWHQQTQRVGHFDAGAWPVHPADFGISTAHYTPFAPCPARLGLYAVLPDAQWVGRMARAGVPTVQLRFKSQDPQAIECEVTAAVQAVKGTSARLFINDHWQHALQAGAYGVHLGQEDLDALPAASLEQLRTSGIRLGVSTHGYAEMVRAARVGPSYLALGAVFPTTLKKMATAAQGLGRLQAYAQLMQHYPLVAIGGIDTTTFDAVLATGVGSIAMVRALVNHDQPENQAHQMMQLLQRHAPA